jgi:hypothetical protein
MKKITLLIVLACIAPISEAFADFYVIAGGKRAKRTVLVSPASTPSASGTALLKAIDGITDASSENPYLLKIEPGVYDIGTYVFSMKPYVDVEGSGQTVTTIRGNNDHNGVVYGADDAELRALTVKNTGGDYPCAIYNKSVSPRITGVRAISGPGAYHTYGIINESASPVIKQVEVVAYSSGTGHTRAVTNSGGASPTMMDMSIQASGPARNTAIHNAGANTKPFMKNVDATATGGTRTIGSASYYSAAPAMTGCTFTASGGSARNWGVYTALDATAHLTNVIARGFNGGSPIGLLVASDGGTAQIRQSLLSGSEKSIRNDSTSTVQIAATQLKGPVGGSLACAQCYNGAYSEVNASCSVP